MWECLYNDKLVHVCIRATASAVGLGMYVTKPANFETMTVWTIFRAGKELGAFIGAN